MNPSVFFPAVFTLVRIWMVCSIDITSKGDPSYESNIVDRSANGDEDYQRELLNTDAEETVNFDITSVPEWPDKRKVKLGSVSGVALDTIGNVYVFHRGDRIWDATTFSLEYVFNRIDLGPISRPTVAIIHPTTGELMYEWGSQMFYLPHGITVDFENNVWVTDVAMHQVLKFPPLLDPKGNNTVPLLTLGNKLKPGSDWTSFCQPTAVAVLSSGEFFVSDGYCNARIIKYSRDGNMILHWGRPSLTAGGPVVPIYHFYIPHDLTLAEDKNLLCVSDRENGRVECFQATNGSFVYQVQSREIGSRIFSASYTPANGGLLFIMNGPSLMGRNIVQGSVVNVNSESFRVVKTFQPKTEEEPVFMNPHDIIVSPNGTSLYVAELNPFRVWKFRIDGLRSVPALALSKNMGLAVPDQTEDGATSGTMLMAIFITAIVLCFGAVLLTSALLYSRGRTRGCSGQCKNAKWLVGRSTVEGFKLGNFLGQQHQGFVKLNNFEESDEDDANISPSFA